MTAKRLSPQRQIDMKNVEIKYAPNGEPHYQTLNHWNNEEWFGLVCTVYGTGKYRFNQIGTTGFAHWQHRFKSKDDAITFLCRSPDDMIWVREGDGQYEVRTTYMEGY